jgi:hypothetical protein
MLRHRSSIPTALLFAVGLLAQTDTATITGIVTDTSGAVVPNAAVEAANNATGLKSRAETNETGAYTISALPIGVYTVTITLQGFQRLERQAVTLHAGTRARLDFELKVGSVTDVVNVTSQAPLLQSETANLNQVVENTTITQMPLNGRNYQQLAMLSPGVLPSRTRNFVTDSFSVNGANMWQNQFVMDGMDNNNYHFGVVIASNQVVKPSIDAIQEFSVETHNFSAEFGRGGGGVIQVTTKSGTNSFHGTAFEFLRNDKLDANNFFNSGRTKPPFRQNQYGGTFGGPVKQDRTFFFGSYQKTSIREKLTLLNTIPTPAMIGGEFGAINIFDPATQAADGTRLQFPNNRIPTSRFDPVAIQELQLYPAPNRAGVQNYLFNPSRDDDDTQIDARLDHRFRDQDTVFLRYSYHDRTRMEPGNLPMPASGGNTAIRLALAHAAVFSHTHVFSGANVVNEVRAAYSRNDGKIDTPNQERLWEQFGFKGTYDRADITGLPLFNLTGYTSLGDRSFAPDPKTVDVKQLVDNVTMTKGRHSLKFGTNIRNFRRYAGTTDYARGIFGFNGQFNFQQAGRGNGNSLADALLGLTNTARLSTPRNATLFSTAAEFYAQDHFKVSRKLTLDLGIRYEYMPPFVEWHDRYATFVIEQGLPGYGTLVNAKDGSREERSLQKPDRNNFSPRIGLAYQLALGTVIRAGYGVFYDTTAQGEFSNLPSGNPPFYLDNQIATSNSSSTSNIIVRNGFPADALKPEVITGRALFSQWPYEFPDGMTHQWNVNVQQALPGSSVLSAAYVGSNTIHRRWGAIDVNQPVPGSTAINSRRLFPDQSNITISLPEGRGNYQALELKFERRFAGGFSTLNGFTWSHAMNTDPGPNTRERVRERGLSPEDMRHRFFSTAIWDIPFGAGRKWITSGPMSHIIGGWQLSTLLVAQAGLPYTPGISANTLNSTGGNRPNRLGDGNLPRGERSPDRWFDKTAFVLPPLYVFGNSGSNIISAPGVVNLDTTLSRTFKLSERLTLDFRTEFFNILNEAHFAAPNMTVDIANGGTISSTDTSARQIQFGMKLIF